MLDAPVSTHRSPLIDSVRAGLAIWVVFAHLVPWAALAQGPIAIGEAGQRFMQDLVTVFQPDNETHPAVLCFIVLSGYCIHRNGLRRNKFDVPGYAIRRAFRIYPVYLLATAFGVGCFLVANHKAPQLAQELSGTAALSATCLAAKLSLVNGVDPNLLYCVYQGNAPLNTVMAEMGLYAVYPALLLLARRWGDRWLLAVVVATWIAGMLYIGANPGSAYWWNHASVAGFLVYWWVGAALLDRRFASLVSRNWHWALVAWVVLTLAIVGHSVDGVVFSEVRKMTQALVFGALVLWIDSRRVALPMLAELPGKAGYSIYAFHAPMVYTLLILGLPWWLVFAMAICAGLVGYLVIEGPSIRSGRRLAAWWAHRRSNLGPLPTGSDASQPGLAASGARFDAVDAAAAATEHRG